jgi:hypothetical protein
MHTSLTHRNVTASVGRDLFAIGPVRWSLSGEVADVRFRHEDFRLDDIGIGTSRTATMAVVGIGIGTGPYRGTSARITALGGWYRNRYGSIVELPAFTGDESLADDELAVIGVRAALDGITVGDRIEIGGSVRYLRLSGAHAPSVPDHEISGTASLSVRLFGVGRKRLSVGGFARFGPAGPSIISDKTFGLRGIWRLK